MNKMLEVCRLELTQQIRRPWTWVSFLALFGIILQISLEAFTANARNGGYFYNSPFIIEQVTMLACAMGWLASASLAGDAGARDVQTRMAPLMYTSSLTRHAYLGGRFLAAFLMNAIILLAPQLALLTSLAMPGVSADLIGPFNARDYLVAYFVLALPGAFIATALFHSAAVLSRRAIAGYLGAIMLFFLMMFSLLFLGIKLDEWTLAKLLDPVGLVSLAEFSSSSTPGQKNIAAVALEGPFLLNRLLWMTVATVALAFTHFRFKFAHVAAGGRRKSNAAPAEALHAEAASRATARPRSTGHAAHANVQAGTVRLHQFAAIARRSFREVAVSWGGLILLAITTILVMVGPTAISHMDVPLLPTTHQLAANVGNTGELLWMIVPLLTVFYVGELVWRERDAGLSEIADAAPVPDWVKLLGKYAGMAMLFVAYQTVLIVACMLIQLQAGYRTFELGLYVRTFYGIQLMDHLLFIVLAFAIHVIVNHKYAAYMVAIAAYVFTVMSASVGVEHHLLVYGTTPSWEYSDISGFGPHLGPWLWFKLYWAAWAVLIATATRLMWVRGRENNFKARWHAARRGLTQATLRTAAVSGVAMMLLGAFIFYNTNVLNAYDTTEDGMARRVEYEQTYGKFRGVPQPSIAGTKLHVELFPSLRRADVQGSYQLVNRSRAPIESIHVALRAGVETGAITFNRTAAVLLADDRLSYRIYKLEQPLAVGDSLQMTFDVTFNPRGFTNSMRDASVVSNGSYFSGNDWLPSLGYRASQEIAGDGERRLRNLPPAAPDPSPDDTTVRYNMAGAEATAFEAVIGTDEGQTAVAPGQLQKRWKDKGRQYFLYATDKPIRNDFSIYSANYAVREAQFGDVLIQVLHDPAHSLNAGTIAKSIRASLEYMSAKLGPYPYRQLRMVEHPAQGLTLHASPINVSYEEEFSLMDSGRDPRNVDFPFAITAHEIAHQWWGNLVTPARADGAALLSESLAWYSALCVVHATYGTEHMERLLELMRQAYLAPRERAGLPLLRARGSFMAYRKGPFAMYALREYVGAAQVDSALRQMVVKYGNGGAPLPTSHDLYRELHVVTPDSLRYLLKDLFAENAFWELESTEVSAKPVGNAWQVTLNVKANKVAVDTLGNATDLPMHDLVEIGLYEAGVNGERGKPMYLRMHRLRRGDQTITITVPARPAVAGVDPRRLLIDTDGEDNFIDVGVTGAPSKRKPAFN